MAGGLDILGLTNTDQALGAAGLSQADIRHGTIIESAVADDLELGLLTHVPSYETIKAEGEDPAATPLQLRKLKALKLYAKWFVAVLLCERWNAIMQLKSDGKTRMDRFDRMDLSAMLANAVARRDNALGILLDLLEPGQARYAYNPLGASSPTYDPVTQSDEEA